ncbi:MAG: CCA tRNA nucleotidyltransferase [Aigarchaeota archaeon]|nr:CCA tRNA nucleotidyltransferase [Candidatus Pelearchaeum maunauluense]
MEEVLSGIKPSSAEEAKLSELAEDLSAALREFLKGSNIINVSVEGSFAKGTWLRNSPEIDIFIQYSPETKREILEKEALEAGRRVITGLGGSFRLRHAEHPYVEGFIDNVRINIVPCYHVEPTRIISAVDRTPYHTLYVKSRISARQRDEVRLLKALLKAANLYGAEIRIGGFSGYLCELLIIKFETLQNLLNSVVRWKPPVVVRIEEDMPTRNELLKLFPNSPLIVPDPVDYLRNVASAITRQKLAEFILLAKLFTRKPSIKFFITINNIINVSEVAGRSFLIILLPLKRDKPPDVIWGELKSSARGIERALVNKKIEVWRWDVWSDEKNKAVIMYELASNELPRIYLHQGPEVYREQALNFIDRHLGSKTSVAGPWIWGDRLYVVKRREEVKVDEILRKMLTSGEIKIAHGLKKEFDECKIITNLEELYRLVNEEKDLMTFVRRFLCGRPSLLQEQ